MTPQKIENWQSRHLTDKEVAAVIGISRATVWRWVTMGKLPAPKKIGGNTTRWDGAALAAALAGQGTA